MARKKVGGLPSILTMWDKDYVIKKQLRRGRKRNIVYGARAMNKQVNSAFGRGTFDWDIFSTNPRRSARVLERSMDRQARGNEYYVKPARHKGTYKVMHMGVDRSHRTKDDVGIADFTKMPKKRVRTIERDGIHYAHISQVISDRKRSLRDPASHYRHKIDKGDIKQIKEDNLFKRLLR